MPQSPSPEASVVISVYAQDTIEVWCERMYRDPKEVISAMARALLEHDEDDDIRRVFCDRWRAHTKDFEVLYDVVTEDQMMIVDVRPVFGVRPVTRSALPV